MKRRSRRAVAAALVLILLAALLLRVFNLGHTLSYDEAWNALSIQDAAGGHTADIFYKNFLRHPPLYSGMGVVYVWITGSGRMGLALAMEMLSILFSLGLVLMVFLCARDWFSTQAGLASAFVLAVMPAARVFDTWVKPESLTLLLSMLFLFLFFRGRYVWAGLMLGLALLGKEIAVFPIGALFLFLLAAGTRKEFKSFFVSLGTGVAVSAWWYLFLSRSTGEFVDFFLGRGAEAANWHRSWLYYLGRIPFDAGWIAGCLLLLAFAALLVSLARHGWPVRVGVRGASRMILLPAAWVLTMYAFLSLSYGKTPWLVYAALPPTALMCGWVIAMFIRGGRIWRYWAVGVLLAAALGSSVAVGFGSYWKGADPTYARTVDYREAAEYVSERGGGAARVLMRLNDIPPIFAFYLESYRPDSIVEPPLLGEEYGKEYDDHTILLMPADVSPEEAARDVLLTKPDFVVVRSISSAGGADLARVFAGVVRPTVIGDIYVFDGEAMVEALEPMVEPVAPSGGQTL